MPVLKKKIRLIATKINFTQFSIVYTVKLESDLKAVGVVFCSNDIKHKDLILKPTIISPDSMEVIFTPSNVTPHFYQSILDKSIRNVDEYDVEKKSIYAVGDIVGYILN